MPNRSSIAVTQGGIKDKGVGDYGPGPNGNYSKPPARRSDVWLRAENPFRYLIDTSHAEPMGAFLNPGLATGEY